MAALFGNLCRTCLATPDHLYSFKAHLKTEETRRSKDASSESQLSIGQLLVSVTNFHLDSVSCVYRRRFCVPFLFVALSPQELPEQVCGDCLNELMCTKTFLDKCEKSEAALKHMLNTSRKTAAMEKGQTKYRISGDGDIKEDVIIVRLGNGNEESVSVRHEGSAEEPSSNASEDDEVEYDENVEDEEEKVKMYQPINTESPQKLLNSLAGGPEQDEAENAVYVDNADEAEYDEDTMIDEAEHTTKQATINCPDCGVVFVHRKSLTRHRINYHTDLGNYEAPSDPLAAPSGHRFKCDHCSVTFVHKKSLEHHKRQERCQKSPVKYHCCVCKREFVRINSLATHLKLHERSVDDSLKLICTVCPADKREEYQDIPSLMCHMQQHTATPRHVCTDCGRCFNMYSSLKDHLRTHTGDRPFICNVCGRGFSQSTNLKQHLNRHQQKKDFKCIAPCKAR